MPLLHGAQVSALLLIVQHVSLFLLMFSFFPLCYSSFPLVFGKKKKKANTNNSHLFPKETFSPHKKVVKLPGKVSGAGKKRNMCCCV